MKARIFVYGSLLLMILLLLAGCEGDRPSTDFPGGQPDPDNPPGGDLGAFISGIAFWATGLASLGLVAVPIIAFLSGFLGPWAILVRKHIWGLILALLATIVAAQLLDWVGDHLVAISLIVGGLCIILLGIAAWRRRVHLEVLLQRDLDGDGKIGVQHGHPVECLTGSISLPLPDIEEDATTFNRREVVDQKAPTEEMIAVDDGEHTVLPGEEVTD